MKAQRWRGPVIDVTVWLVVSVLMYVAATVSGDLPPRPIGLPAVLAIAVIGCWSALARHAPRTSLVGAVLCTYLSFAFVLPAFSPAWALFVPLLAVGRAGRLRWGAAAIAVYVGFAAPYRVLGERETETVGQVVVNTTQDAALLAVVLLLGETIRSRLALREESALRLKVAEQEHDRRITDERLRIAHDLHDVLAHTVTVVNIQAGVAAESLDRQPQRARDALELVGAASRDAMADLRGTIEVLRDESPRRSDLGPAPGVAQVPALVEAVESAGLRATLAVTGEPVALRPAIELAVYRVAQESLTNVLRHAHARRVHVSLHHGANGVRVEVRDDGRGPGPDSGGFGMRGMSERVAALGGELWCGRADDGPGYVVRARLPKEGAR